jgi:predicted MFS family arabinose efflux permease
MGLVMPSSFDFILASVPPDHAGCASGVISTAQQIGYAVGIAIVGVVFFTFVASNAS